MTFNFIFLLFFLSDLNRLFWFFLNHLEEIRDGIIKRINKILIGKTPVERNTIYYLYQNLFILVVLTWWKTNTFQISMKIHFKKWKLICKPYFLLHLICSLARHLWGKKTIYYVYQKNFYLLFWPNENK